MERDERINKNGGVGLTKRRKIKAKGNDKGHIVLASC